MDAGLGFGQYIGEMFVGIVLLAFAAGFRQWSNTLKESMKQVIDKLESISAEFHLHALNTERRVTRVETKIDTLARIDRRIEQEIKEVGKQQ